MRCICCGLPVCHAVKDIAGKAGYEKAATGCLKENLSGTRYGAYPNYNWCIKPDGEKGEIKWDKTKNSGAGGYNCKAKSYPGRACVYGEPENGKDADSMQACIIAKKGASSASQPALLHACGHDLSRRATCDVRRVTCDVRLAI